ncbi:putative peroxisomal biogenesis factor 10 [Cephus cinctus]|uniref:RING-type E3 ubiquitin transferase n=1 Tax=Cephus cinctus TaxID=211228 RepID=A0AAJ7FMV4_CEPCN|nr:putative peroxisomal biogenesis factor 10 [Cephus cinctus]
MDSVNHYRKHGLRVASQAEILRSHQRDNDFIKDLRDQLSDILHKFGCRNLISVVNSSIPIKLVYFFFTSGLGNQTLGEEYTGIVQANFKARKIPSLTARVLAILLECFGEQILLKMLEKLQTSVNHPQSELRPEAINCINKLLSGLRATIPIFILAHRGLFYIYGRYYSLGRRVAGIDYAKVYGQYVTDGVSWGLRLLGIATLIQCILRFRQSLQVTTADSNSIEVEESIGGKCHLCLEAKPTTATPCGHLFCWFCLADWLSGRPQCPICRERVNPSRIIPLMNL